MKPWLVIGLLGMTGVLAVRAEDLFSQRVTLAEFDAAGLAKLTPAERVQHDELVRKYSRPGGENEAAERVPKTGPGGMLVRSVG
ncbi:MAG: hypothetical protein EXS39_03585 [Opitutaceae bacterium]|nr:hypothetical protein [Opitutaceae bacterium]